jgi:hypothetical protein
MYLGYGNCSALIHLIAKRPWLVSALGLVVVGGSYLYAAEHQSLRPEHPRSQIQVAKATDDSTSARMTRNPNGSKAIFGKESSSEVLRALDLLLKAELTTITKRG